MHPPFPPSSPPTEHLRHHLDALLRLGAVAIIAYNAPPILLGVALALLLYLRYANHYRASNRELRRLASVARSPIYSSFLEASTARRRFAP